MLKYLQPMKSWGLNKRFAVVFSALAAIGTALLEIADVLPDGNAKTAVVTAVMAGNGFVVQMRVWSKHAVDAITAVG
jgi:hypothetical protein